MTSNCFITTWYSVQREVGDMFGLRKNIFLVDFSCSYRFLLDVRNTWLLFSLILYPIDNGYLLILHNFKIHQLLVQRPLKEQGSSDKRSDEETPGTLRYNTSSPPWMWVGWLPNSLRAGSVLNTQQEATKTKERSRGTSVGKVCVPVVKSTWSLLYLTCPVINVAVFSFVHCDKIGILWFEIIGSVSEAGKYLA